MPKISPNDGHMFEEDPLHKGCCKLCGCEGATHRRTSMEPSRDKYPYKGTCANCGYLRMFFSEIPDANMSLACIPDITIYPDGSPVNASDQILCQECGVSSLMIVREREEACLGH